MIRVAINGYGRIGRNILRALYEGPHRDAIKIVAINDMAHLKTIAHLTKYDSTHGIFAGEISTTDDQIIVNGDPIAVFAERDPAQLPWQALNVDVVYECTGHFTEGAKASLHLKAGAKKC